MKNSKIVLLGLAALFSINVSSQESPSGEYKKNSLYTSVGTWFFYSEVELTYERMHWKLESPTKSTYIGSQFSLGLVESFAYGTSLKLAPAAVLLHGNGRSHFETSIGCNAYYEKNIEDVFSYFSPRLSLGYRFQNMTKSKMIFRTGLEWPKGLYLGVGWNF